MDAAGGDELPLGAEAAAEAAAAEAEAAAVAEAAAEAPAAATEVVEEEAEEAAEAAAPESAARPENALEADTSPSPGHSPDAEAAEEGRDKPAETTAAAEPPQAGEPPVVETLEISTDMILVTISGRSVARLQNQNLTKAAGKEIETFSRTTSVDVKPGTTTFASLVEAAVQTILGDHAVKVKLSQEGSLHVTGSIKQSVKFDQPLVISTPSARKKRHVLVALVDAVPYRDAFDSARPCRSRSGSGARDRLSLCTRQAHGRARTTATTCPQNTHARHAPGQASAPPRPVMGRRLARQRRAQGRQHRPHWQAPLLRRQRP